MEKSKSKSVERTLVDDILDETFVQLSNRTDFDKGLLESLRNASVVGKMTKATDIQSLIQKTITGKPNETA